MLIRFLTASSIILTTAMAITPAKPGVVPSEGVIEQAAIMAETYKQGGLAAKMQRVKAANLEAARNGMRDLREDVYGSFPVIMGSYVDSDDSPNVVDQLQRQLFDGPWPTITMAEHYEQMSYGQYHLSGTVYGWYELSQTGFHYGGIDNGWDGGVGDFLTESLDLADVEIDFTQYDNDGDDGIPNSGDDDGRVDATFFVHSGRGGETGGAHIWSHRWVYSAASGTHAPYQTNDIGFNGQPIEIQDYIMQPAVAGGSQGSGGLIEIGVFSHEFGHALGLPDLYDTDYSSNGVGSWCLMASGSWSSPSSPVHFSAWCKEMLGWTIPITADHNVENFEFPNAEENAFALRLWTHGNPDSVSGQYGQFGYWGSWVPREYYLIENRQRLGSETSLPGTGLVIWHIDNSRTTNSNENHRMVDVKAADNYFNGSNSGDSWPGTTNNRNFDYQTLPSSIGWEGVNTEVAVLNISDTGPTMWADIEVYESNPNLNIIQMLVSEFNGDGIFAPGENVLIWLTVENMGGPATNATATLSVEGEFIELVDTVISFDTMDFLGSATSNQAFEFNISDSFSTGPVTFTVSFEADELNTPTEIEFDLLLGVPDIVVVDDDGDLDGPLNYQSYITGALNAAELVHVVWDIEERDLPDLDWLENFQSVIWFGGDNPAPLNTEKTQLMSNYLNAGGNLLLTGQNISTGDATVSNFIRDHFATEVLADDINTANVYSDPSHEFFQLTDRFSIGNEAGANNQRTADSFTLLEGGTSMFMYPTAGMATGGVSIKNETYSAVLLGFGLEALTHFDGDTNFSRGQLTARLLDWMLTPTTSVASETYLQPLSSGITTSYPNPFNPSINFAVQMEGEQVGMVQILDVRGALVETMAVQHTGVLTWHPSANTSGGIYFVQLLVDGQISGDLKKVTYLK